MTEQKISFMNWMKLIDETLLAAQGESLADVLDDPVQRFPPVYRAVVEAGLKAGGLPAALESLATSARRLAETRQIVVAAFVYPLLVVLVAWGFFLLFVTQVAPGMAGLMQDARVPGTALVQILAGCGRSVEYWGPAVPLAVLILASFWWWHAGRASLVEPRWSGTLFGWLPWIGPLVRLSRIATFGEVLALLVENRVPLGEALVLAANASGDPPMLEAARTMAQQIDRGETLQAGSTGSLAFPPLLRWLLAAGGQHGALVPALRHAARTYRDRAQHQAALAAVLLPVFVTLLIGGSVTLLYALAIFAPYAAMLKGISAVIVLGFAVG